MQTPQVQFSFFVVVLIVFLVLCMAIAVTSSASPLSSTLEFSGPEALAMHIPICFTVKIAIAHTPLKMKSNQILICNAVTI